MTIIAYIAAVIVMLPLIFIFSFGMTIFAMSGLVRAAEKLSIGKKNEDNSNT